MIAWGAFIYYASRWWGWNGVTGITSGNINEWSWSRLLAELLILGAAWDDRRRFRFPFIRVISAVVFWFFAIDLSLAGGELGARGRSIIGLLYLAIGQATEKPSAFWLHLVGGALIGGALLHWFHTSDGDFAAISIFSVLFVLVADRTGRSSWAVYGTIGFFAATIHYLIGSPTQFVEGVFGISQPCPSSAAPLTRCVVGLQISPWAPALAFGLLGLWLVLLGMLGKRKKGHKHTAVVVEKTTVVVEAIDEPRPA